MPVNKRCYCGSNKNFTDCCQPFINKKALPQTPEQLMRSRFSAYAIGNAQYIYDTYASSSQLAQSVEDISDWGDSCTWLALQIHSINQGNVAKNEVCEQFVEFSAFYITDNILYELRENSRFILEQDQNNKNAEKTWCYIDGDIIEHGELSIIKRKDTCPCNNYPTTWVVNKAKKFKQCCGK